MTSYDTRWDEAESEVDLSTPWRVWVKQKDGTYFHDTSMPNPLTFIAERWISITTEYGETELLTGSDRNGGKWSVLPGTLMLKKGLVEGIFDGWNDETKSFEVKQNLGKVEPGEIVSIKDEGFQEGGKGDKYRKHRVSRKAAVENPGAPPPKAQTAPSAQFDDDDIPFDDGVPD